MQICPWPGALPVPDNGVLVLSIAMAPAHGRRDAARAAIRLALRQVLAGVLTLPLEAITVVATPGQAPHVRIAGQAGRGIGCSFSHEEGLSLAAVNLHGAVGVDLMAVRAIDDWQALASDYLGPEVAQRLRALPAARRPRALAQAWSAHEARLKCAGLALAEWRPGAQAPCRVIALEPPAGIINFVATLALLA